MALSLCLLALSACAAPAAAPRAAPPEAARARAALAAVTVDNRTGERLVVLYRLGTRPVTEVAVGSVPPGSVTEMAPVPAGESVILLARTPEGRELVLPARAFEVGAAWTWIIPADAPFRAPPDPQAAR